MTESAHHARAGHRRGPIPAGIHRFRGAVAHLAPEGMRGSAFGLQAALQSIGNLAASAIAGALWTLISTAAAFLYVAAWMAVALTGMLLAGRGDSRSDGLHSL